MRNALLNIVQQNEFNGEIVARKNELFNLLNESNNQSMQSTLNKNNIQQNQEFKSQNIFKNIQQIRLKSLNTSKHISLKSPNTSYYQDQSNSNFQTTINSQPFHISKKDNIKQMHYLKDQFNPFQSIKNLKTNQTSTNFLNSFFAETNETYDKLHQTNLTQQSDISNNIQTASYPNTLNSELFTNQNTSILVRGQRKNSDAQFVQKIVQQTQSNLLQMNASQTVLNSTQNQQQKYLPNYQPKSSSFHSTKNLMKESIQKFILTEETAREFSIQSLNKEEESSFSHKASDIFKSRAFSKLDLNGSKEILQKSFVDQQSYYFQQQKQQNIIQPNKRSDKLLIGSQSLSKLNSKKKLKTYIQQKQSFLHETSSYIQEIEFINIKQAEQLKIDIELSPLQRKRKNKLKETSNNQNENSKLSQQTNLCQQLYQDFDLFIQKLNNYKTSMGELYKILTDIEDRAFNCINISVSLQIKYIKCLLASLCSDLDISLKSWKEFLKVCNCSQTFLYKIIGYKNMAEIYRKKGEYDRQLAYLKKLLKYSWFYNKKDFENYAYEQISKAYFYKNNLELAIFFHKRMIDYNLETNNSRLKQLGIQLVKYEQEQKMKTLQDNSFSEDEFELEQFKTAGLSQNQLQSQSIKEAKFDTDSLKKNQSQEILQRSPSIGLNEQSILQNQMNESIKNTRLNKYKFNNNISSLEGMKAIATIKNKMSIPYGPITPKALYRKHGQVNLRGNIDISSDKLKFKVMKNNLIKNFDKIYINHLSNSRQIDAMVNLNNRIHEKTIELISNDAMRLKKVSIIMKRVIEQVKENIQYFYYQCQIKVNQLNNS
ncbi:hypothetical protein TTHERM_00299860 (macronuclear) [Tetrahymena thermophila SB210]|uniref:Tetratricopeptide repeat protein n=1 Tax=Tetrahymena thermophila (strain SB210) TaxID=312017 RepID=I7MIC1_TETTS|nr:hypothetical protein TTHERM_00299860 [Tetrahymena thermophila SB210]EAS04268.1 hypothetical protein TTHERM_00299860 [Tetrahymena thermophila SB210]|eukprot:XP_001024513.1 hypothetical protein TTHERM_00299860 [Tetrahymena thermophila SB210]